MDKTLDVYWCEEHRSTTVGNNCLCGNAIIIGFVTYVEKTDG